MFKDIDPKVSFPQLEEKILKFWQENQIFQKSLENRKDSPKFTFYDGPPFANGLPHYGHILAMTIKDTVCRFKTMEGFYVPRRGGWDTHGLPVEYEVEKELGISGKPEIEKYGIAHFNQKARQSVLRYTKEWIKTMERMGRWIDWQNAYTTMDRDYIESVWWVFAQIYNKGLIYQGYKSLPYCPRCGTPLSNFEVNQGYQDNVEDPSVFVKFKLINQSTNQLINYFLAWTTTPWTLPGNTALAVGKNIKYEEIELLSTKEKLILAKDRLSVIDEKYNKIREIDGKDLVGFEYEPLYDQKKNVDQTKKIYQVVTADFVSTEDGTGLVHIAPAFGEEDLELAGKESLALAQTVDPAGNIRKDLKIPGEGKFVKEADEEILADLEKRGLIFHKETIRHTYPFCWRCETPLIYYATTTWFVKVSALREELVKNNQEIHWLPEHLKTGRFGKWLAEARDWAVSRNRYWGAPIPVWQCQKCQKNIVVGSIEELENLSGQDLSKTDLHKPAIDQVEISCNCGGKAKRIPEVLDCWFESGSMPYAHIHYPFENKENFQKSFPADFIAEGIDQTRGWFYTLHVIATILFAKNAFKNVVVNGTVLATDGKKLSKKLRNYDEPQVIFDGAGVDALRYFLLASTPMGEDYRFSTEAVRMVTRKVLLPLWNTLSFFTTYANLDGWQPAVEDGSRKTPLGMQSRNILDRWIFSRLNQTIADIKKSMAEYDLTRASREIEEIITDLSQWYLRRSRRRRDNDFYAALYFVLKNLAIIIAPFLPFIAENIWQILKTKKDSLSVHLCGWPKMGEIDGEIIQDMQKVRDFAEKGLALRAEKEIRVRQPLAKFEINLDLPQKFQEILKDELNVLEITRGKEIKLDTKITAQLKEEGIIRDILRLTQEQRKKAGLLPGKPVDLYYEAEGEVARIFAKFKERIQKTTQTNLINQKSSKIKTQGEEIINNQKIWLGVK